MIRAMIVDDEKYIRDELKYYLEKIDGIKVCTETGDGDDVFDLIDKIKPDVVFLDIHLQSINGLIIARKILDKENPPYIVLATAYDQYAVQGFDIGVVDYLVKPFNEQRVNKCIDRIKEYNMLKTSKKLEAKSNQIITKTDKICVSKENKLLILDINEIVYLEYLNRDILIYTKNDKYNYNNSTLKEIENKYREYDFLRTHKSFIVNTNFIKEVIPWFNYTYKIKLKHYDNVEIPVSRNYIKKFKALLGL